MLVQTRERIIRTLYKLEKVKHIDKITTKNIMEQCGLTRRTFYHYFRDIYDPMDTIADQELEELLEESMAAPAPEEVLKCFFRYLLPHRGRSERIMEGREYIMLAKAMFDKVYRCFSRLIEGKGRPLNMKKDKMGLAIHFFIYSILGILMERRFQTEEDISKIADQLVRPIKGRKTTFPESSSEWCPKVRPETRVGICRDLYSAFINTKTGRQRAGPPTRPCIQKVIGV